MRASISLPPSPSPPPPGTQGQPAAFGGALSPSRRCLAWEEIAAGLKSEHLVTETASVLPHGKKRRTVILFIVRTLAVPRTYSSTGEFQKLLSFPPCVSPLHEIPRPVPGIVVVTRIKVTLSVSLIMF